MNNSDKRPLSRHQEVALLLPWYVNNTLQGDEYVLVEAHLKNCLVCRMELANLLKLSTAMLNSDTLEPIEHAAFQQLKNRIHTTAQPVRTKPRIAALFASCRLWLARGRSVKMFSQYPGIVLPAILFFAMLLVVPGFFVVQPISGNQYHTLSSSKSKTSLENEIRVVFASDITQQQMSHILAAVQGSIIAGPTPQGVYRVRVGKGDMTEQDIFKIVSLLRSKKQVIFAEPSFVLLTSTTQDPG